MPVSQLDIPLATARQLPAQQLRQPTCELGTPLTSTEAALLGIWEELLHTDDISVTDSFPDIGGHSLLVALMAARIREDFGADIPVAIIYQDPTARGIATAIDAALRAGVSAPGGGQP
jgi:hypothetical protein